MIVQYCKQPVKECQGVNSDAIVERVFVREQDEIDDRVKKSKQRMVRIVYIKYRVNNKRESDTKGKKEKEY